MIDFFYKIVITLFVYCTDFVINVANLLALSYYEINALIFCIIWPIVTIILLVIYFILRIEYRRLAHV